jgi:protoporphyrinogen/coproporphyrinogen III oxidase
MTPAHLLIAGGGIAGLSAAYHAVKASQERSFPLRLTLVEAGLHWGGKITTERVENEGGQFIIEGGPDTFLATKPWGVALCQALGLGERLHGTNPHHKNTYVLHRDRLMPLPDGLAMMIPTNIRAILKSPLVSWPAKARMGMDFLIPPAHPNGDESLGHFVSRRLGREAYENLIEPLMSGIYAGDGDQLSLQSTFPYLRDLELKHGSLARGALKMRPKAGGKAVQGSRSAFLTPTTGLAEIVEALVERLKESEVDLRLGTAVLGLARHEAGFVVELANGEIEQVDGLILATPAYTSGSLVSSFDPELAVTLGEIPYASTATISLAYRLEDLRCSLDGYGYVIPRREGREALACTWTSTKFPHRAPDGFALLRVFIGRAGQEQHLPRDPGSLETIARRELEQTLGITARPILTRSFMWENSMPQYNLGHPELLARISRQLEKHPGLALAGNGYRGIGIPDCIHSGELAVEAVIPRLIQADNWVEQVKYTVYRS